MVDVVLGEAVLLDVVVRHERDRPGTIAERTHHLLALVGFGSLAPRNVALVEAEVAVRAQLAGTRLVVLETEQGRKSSVALITDELKIVENNDVTKIVTSSNT